MDFETTEFDKSSEFLYESIKEYGAYVETPILIILGLGIIKDIKMPIM